MAVKKMQEETASMIDTFREFKETKNIDRTTLVSVLEESFRNVLAKIFGSDENFDVIVNPDKGDFEIYRNRVVVADGEVEDENKEIPYSFRAPEAFSLADEFSGTYATPKDAPLFTELLPLSAEFIVVSFSCDPLFSGTLPFIRSVRSFSFSNITRYLLCFFLCLYYKDAL